MPYACSIWEYNYTTIAIVIGFIAIPSIFAQTTLLATSSRSSTNGTLDTILGAPFFEDRGSKVTGTRVINTNPVQTEDSFVANVTIRGIGNATDSGTFITTHKSNGITTSEGQGIISNADGEIATTLQRI